MTVELTRSVVSRGGTSRNWLSRERTTVWASARGDAVAIETSIASKGGGTTRIRIDMDVGDLGALIEEVATTVPGAPEAALTAVGAACRRLVERSQRANSEVVGAISGMFDVAMYVRTNCRLSESERDARMVALVGQISGHLEAAISDE
jgi:hypothetical protein